MEKEADRDRFIDRYPGLDDAFRDKMRNVQSAWLEDDRHFGCWAPDPEVRLDMLLRQGIALYFSEGYGVDGRQGWIEQGLGLYLTHRLVGTRRSFAISQDERSSAGVAALAKRIGDPRSDYYVLAAESLAERTPRQLAISLGKTVNSMTSEDIVATYALSAWLVETQPAEVLAEIFTRCGQGDSPIEVFEGELGLELVELRAKLLRWLGENSEKVR